jgi:hypothetical protein
MDSRVMKGYYYLDTSAQVKYYVSEPGTAWIRQLVNTVDPDTGQRANQLFTVAISGRGNSRFRSHCSHGPHQ